MQEVSGLWAKKDVVCSSGGGSGSMLMHAVSKPACVLGACIPSMRSPAVPPLPTCLPAQLQGCLSPITTPTGSAGATRCRTTSWVDSCRQWRRLMLLSMHCTTRLFYRAT
jgi:hypothetical protein